MGHPVVGVVLALALLSGTGVVGATAPTSSTVVTVLGGTAAVPAPVADGLVPCAATVARVAGADRYDTAARLAAAAGGTGGTVVVASGVDFPDALAAAPFVAARDGALLLTRPTELPEPTRAELRRRAPDEIVVLGGSAAVTAAVVAELESFAPTRRIGGADRFATAAAVAGEVASPGGTVYVVSGLTFADALAVGPVAGRDGAPLLLVVPDRIPAPTAAALDALRPAEIVVVGGSAVVGEAVAAALAERATVRRIAGRDRFETAAAVAAAAYPEPPGGAVIATGLAFADALAGGPAAARAGHPLLLVAVDLDVPVADQLARVLDGPCRAVTVAVDGLEALTLGPSSIGRTVLTAAIGAGQVHLTSLTDTGAVLLVGGATATATYPTPAGGVPAVTWEQAVPADVTTVGLRQPWREEPVAAAPITLAWQYTGDSARYRDEVAAAPGLTVTAPFRYYLDTAGNLVGGADPAFIADMHARGVAVWPTIHTCGATCIRAALSDAARRGDLARRIAADAIAAGADGVNVDIEGFEVAERDAVTDFVLQLSAQVQPHGLVTSYDFTAMTDTWITPPPGYEFWSTAPDRRAISAAVDYAVLMAYDEFNRFRPAGPVASPGWVEESLRYQLRFSDPHKTLLGVPLYGRVWRGTTPATATMADMERFARDGRRTPDPRFGVDRIDLPDGRYTWAETVAGLPHRTSLVETFGLAGTASWRLGFDIPEVWAVLAPR
jgi:putative cell wall-binding protein